MTRTVMYKPGYQPHAYPQCSLNNTKAPTWKLRLSAPITRSFSAKQTRQRESGPLDLWRHRALKLATFEKKKRRQISVYWHVLFGQCRSTQDGHALHNTCSVWSRLTDWAESSTRMWRKTYSVTAHTWTFARFHRHYAAPRYNCWVTKICYRRPHALNFYLHPRWSYKSRQFDAFVNQPHRFHQLTNLIMTLSTHIVRCIALTPKLGMKIIVFICMWRNRDDNLQDELPVFFDIHSINRLEQNAES